MIKDPIQGLIDFVNEVKPYHTKIIEVLVDYIYEETMKVGFEEQHLTQVVQQYDFHLSHLCSEGYDLQPWDEIYKKKLNPTIDIRTEFPEGFLWIIVPLQTLTYATEVCYQFKYKQWIKFTNIRFENNAPDSVGLPGQYWFNKTTQELFLYNGGTWNLIPSSNYFVGTSEIDIPQYPLSNSPYSRPGLMIGLSSNFPTNADILKIVSPDIIFIEGNHVANIMSGDEFAIVNSYGNDGIWQIIDVPTFTSVSIYDSNMNLINVPATAIRVEFKQFLPNNYLTNIIPRTLITSSSESNFDNFSNFDFPEIKCSSPTTTSTKFKEYYTIDINIPVSPYAEIVNVYPTTSLNSGYFVIQNPNPQNTSTSNNSGSNNYVRSFPKGSKFEIKGSGNNDGLWTVKSIEFINGFTIIVPEENIPRNPVDVGSLDIVEPYGMVVASMAGFNEKISITYFENTNPNGWGGYDHFVSPTTKIKNLNIINRQITIFGDLRRFFQPNTFITISRQSQTWNYLVDSVFYDNTTDETTITVQQPLSSLQTNDLTNLYVSGEPTFLRSIGWSQIPWQINESPWMTIIDTELLTGPGVNVIHLFDTVTQQQMSYFQADYFELGGFENILNQILPL